LSNEFDERIPESWYEKTESKLVCLHCHKAFNKEYKSKQFHRRKKTRGANMFSIWAWHNFRKHLLKCWGWQGNDEKEP
jgi:hypothetical protein